MYVFPIPNPLLLQPPPQNTFVKPCNIYIWASDHVYRVLGPGDSPPPSHTPLLHQKQ